MTGSRATVLYAYEDPHISRHGYGAVDSATAMSVVIYSAAGESPRPGVDIDEFVSPSFLVDPSRQPPSIWKAFARQ
jgi:hypothetical protein